MVNVLNEYMASWTIYGECWGCVGHLNQMGAQASKRSFNVWKGFQTHKSHKLQPFSPVDEGVLDTSSDWVDEQFF